MKRYLTPEQRNNKSDKELEDHILLMLENSKHDKRSVYPVSSQNLLNDLFNDPDGSNDKIDNRFSQRYYKILRSLDERHIIIKFQKNGSEYIELDENSKESSPNNNIKESDGMEKQKSLDSKKVFVVHGRDESARKAMFIFLRSIGLEPLEWSQAVKATGKPSPYISEILDKAFSEAQAVVVLMTPDDKACLQEHFWRKDESKYEKELTGQARPNVLFEAGMAMGRYPERTILVQLGKLRPFSDIDGIHSVRMENNSQKRQELADRLVMAGCSVDLSGTDWHNSGDFEIKPNSINNQNEEKGSIVGFVY
jgi:predicted nucleotide-binding protein